MKNKLSGSISIMRYTGTREGIEIRVRDERSDRLVIVVDMTVEGLGGAITGMADIPCSFDLDTSGVIGKQREHKEVLVELPKNRMTRLDDNQAKKLLKPFEVDGWIGHTRDLDNHHRHSREGDREFALVMFERWVEVKEADEGGDQK